MEADVSYFKFNSSMGDNTSFAMPIMTTARVLTSRPTTQPWLVSLRFVCEGGLTLPIAVLGILGNLLAFIVLCNHKQKSTTRVLLQALAIIDGLVLMTTLLTRAFRVVIKGYAGGYAFMYIFRWMYPAVYILRLGGTWLTVLLTVDRYIAVCLPLHAQRLCTLKRTYFLMAILLLVTTLLSLPRFFEYEIYDHKGMKGIRPTELISNQYYTVGYRIKVFFIIMYLMPMVILVTLNTLLLKTLRLASSHRNSLQENPPPSGRTKTSLSSTQSNDAFASLHGGQDGRPSGIMHQVSSRSHNRSVTIIVVTIVLVCIICNITAMVAHVIFSLVTAFQHLAHLQIVRRVSSNISNVLLTISSAINFIIYCLCSRNFRVVFIKTFHLECLVRYIRKRRTQDPHSQKANSSSATSYISLLRFTSNMNKNNSDHAPHARELC